LLAALRLRHSDRFLRTPAPRAPRAGGPRSAGRRTARRTGEQQCHWGPFAAAHRASGR
jgi:hypothetical protein